MGREWEKRNKTLRQMPKGGRNMNSIGQLQDFFCRYRQFVSQNHQDYHGGLVSFFDRMRPESSRLLAKVREDASATSTPDLRVAFHETVDFQDFFCRYGQFIVDAEKQSCSAFGNFFDRVGPDLTRLLEAVRQEERFVAPRFNIFTALHIERKETVLHTPMLAHLLDPSASHSQGSIFLRRFFEILGRLPCSVPPDISSEGGQWTVLREFYIAGVGILDLLIENPGKKYIIVIENKIDANDHSDQLPRYKEWMEKNRSDYKWRQLLYLTPDGRCPTSSESRDWLCLSYNKDIRRFLKEALQDVKAPAVQELVRQYLAILTHWMEDSDD
jgi:hypothetical protein